MPHKDRRYVMNLSLRPEQLKSIRTLAQAEGNVLAAVVRRLIAKGLAAEQVPTRE